VLFQLDGANGANAVEWVTQFPEFLVPVAEVTVDAAAPHDVLEVVGIGHSEPLEDAEFVPRSDSATKPRWA
jgi:hypothetical protein